MQSIKQTYIMSPTPEDIIEIRDSPKHTIDDNNLTEKNMTDKKGFDHSMQAARYVTIQSVEDEVFTDKVAQHEYEKLSKVGKMVIIRVVRVFLVVGIIRTKYNNNIKIIQKFKPSTFSPQPDRMT